MQRVYRTFDLLEAHLIAGFLRSEGVDAQLFDADFVRQDWLAAIAYGGYRVMAADEHVGMARKLIADRQANAFALEEVDPCAPVCSRCGSKDTAEDPVPRRIAFALVLFFKLPVFPFLRRCRCQTCGNRWKAASTDTFADLARRADAAADDVR